MTDLLCIYHGNCADGFTAAWAFYKRFPDAEFHAGVHGESPPDVTDKRVVIVDFSYPKNVLALMSQSAKSILILDHHKSAEEDLRHLATPPSKRGEGWIPDKGVYSLFDMERSGAMITWEYFHSNRPSDLVVHVQDRDLWLFKRQQTRAFNANLFSYEYTFENWDKIHNLCADDYKYEQFVKEGEAIERKHFKDIRELIKVAATRTGGFSKHDAPMLNCPYFFSSDAGHIMCKDEPFAICYYDTATHRVYSLRSDENGLDVSVIASEFGGGGHKHAASFRVPLDQI